jgi:hypothetical protein
MLNLAKKELTTAQVAKNPSRHYANTKKLDFEAGVLGESFVFSERFFLSKKRKKKNLFLLAFSKH